MNNCLQSYNVLHVCGNLSIGNKYLANIYMYTWHFAVVEAMFCSWSHRVVLFYSTSNIHDKMCDLNVFSISLVFGPTHCLLIVMNLCHSPLHCLAGQITPSPIRPWGGIHEWGHNLWRAYLQAGHCWAWGWPIWNVVFMGALIVSHCCAWSQLLEYRLSTNELLHCVWAKGLFVQLDTEAGIDILHNNQ